MQFRIACLTAVLGLSASLASGAPTVKRSENFSPFPLQDGFPSPSKVQVKDIEEHALGTLPNGPPPPKISQEGITNLQVIAFNELFEVAFFTELLYNVTQQVPGYEVDDCDELEYLKKTLTAIRAQEELHALNANGALAHFNVTPIEACKYDFPVSDLRSAIELASTFTSVVLGTLQDVIQVFAENSDAGITRGVASVLGQEGEQEGFFRLSLGKVASELPFLTTSTRDFAFNAVNQSFIAPGSCPNTNTINVKSFKPLTLKTPVKEAKTQDIELAFDNTASEDVSKLSLVYINQQNVPIVEKFQVVSIQGSMVTIKATFPHDEDELNGLTIVALAEGDTAQFTNATAVSNATKFGPALIIVN